MQIWVPDARSPAFAAEAHRQSLAVAQSSWAKEDQDFIDAAYDVSDASVDGASHGLGWRRPAWLDRSFS